MKKQLLLKHRGIFIALLSFLCVTSIKAQTTYTVGPGGTYANIGAAFTGIGNISGISGGIILELQNNDAEANVSIAAVAGADATHPVIIRPATGATSCSITSSTTTAALTLTGCSYVTIDGRPGGSGSSVLTISNTNTGGVALQVTANNNIIQYTTLQGMNTTITAGVVVFGASTANVINYCDIRDVPSTGTPANGIYSASASTNTVSNSNIYNYYQSTVNNAGINLSGSVNGWTITGNSFYNTGSMERSIGTVWVHAISISNTSNTSAFTVTYNYIGGSAPQCGGVNKDLIGVSNAASTTGPDFRGIFLTVNTTTTSLIQNNTIKNIAISSGKNSGGESAYDMTHFIVCENGNVDISNNVIGSNTDNTSITYYNTNSTNTAANVVIPVFLKGNGTAIIKNNTIGGLYLNARSDFNGKMVLYVVYVGGTRSGTIDVENNTIGSTATGITSGANMSIRNMIYKNSTTAASNGTYAFRFNSTGACTVTLKNNTVANIYATNVNDNLLAGMSLETSNASSTFDVSGNTIRDLMGGASGANVKWSECGIISSAKSTYDKVLIHNNTIYNLSGINSSGQIINGIILASGVAGNGASVYNNSIYNLVPIGTGSSFSTNGIAIADAGFNATCKIYNNMIRLGYDLSGTAVTTDNVIRGISEYRAGASDILFNTVYIGGAGVVAATNPSAAFYSNITPSAVRLIENNIFDNERAGSAGKHYAIQLANITTTTSNYNDLLSASGYIGSFGGVDKVTLADWQGVAVEANSINVTPVYVNATTTTPDLHLTATAGTGTAVASVTTDFDGETRTSPPGIGADELDATSYTTTWDGSAWSNGTPTTGVNTLISGGYTGAGFTCNNLKIQAATTFTSDATINGDLRLYNNLSIGSSILTLKGNTTVWGYSINASAGSVVFSGTSAQGASFTAINNLTIYNSAGVTISSPLTLSGTLTLTSGTLTIPLTLGTGATIVRTAGSLSATPTFGTTLNVTYNGASQQTTSNEVPASGTTVNLTVNNSTGVKLGVNLSFNNITLTSGNLIANGKNLTITGNTSGAGSIDCGTTQSVYYNGTSAQTISNVSSIYNMSVDNPAGATLATNLTIRSVLSLNNGNLTTGAYTLTFSSAVSTTAVTVGSYNIVTGPTGTVAYTGGVNQQIANLNGAVYNLTTNTATLMAATTVSGTLTLNSGMLTNTNTLTLANGATIVRSTGTLSAVPTFGTTVNVNYTGAVTTGNELPTTASTLNNLTVGAAVTLNAASTVNGTLGLTSGTLTTGVNTLTLNGATTAGSGLISTGSTGTLVFGGITEQTLANTNLTGSAVNILTVNAGAKLTTSGAIAATAINVLSDVANGTGTIINGGTVTSSTANVQQYLTGADANTDDKPDGRYWYLTSPVVGSTSNAFTPATNYLWSYNEARSDLASVYTRITATDTPLTPGTGYVARMAANGNISLSGTSLFNEDITFTNLGYASATKQGFNLIGNPYPCYLDIRTAFTDATGIETSAWYRSSTDGLSNVFDTFNASSGASIAISSGVNTASLAIIPPMQAFWVRATNTTNSLTFSKTTRSHKPATIGNNLRSAATSDVKQIRLNVSNGTNTDQTLIGFYAQAMDEFDNCDSRKMFNGVANLPEIYTLAGSTQVAINGLPLLTDTREIALGFKTAQAGSFTIKAAEILDLEADQTVILKDKQLNVSQNLTEQPVYNFSSDAVTTTTRFSIVIGKVATALATVNNPVFAVCATNGNMLEVALSGVNTNSARITVFNAVGQELASFKASGSKTVIGKRFESGVYVVKVVAPGFQATRKVIINN